MNTIDFQLISKSNKIPSESLFQTWVNSVLIDQSEDSEIVIRVVDEAEMTRFNEKYRDKHGSTNILSFPFQVPQGIESVLLGDLLLCAPVIEEEAWQQKKLLNHHWAHIIVHGVLHLLAYDHSNEVDAEEMETKEIEILKTIKITNPYQEKV
ncbi:MAG: rRNA maturation RNase YbeY [Methylococcales symbiont of Hymedesmia sp. n. MRB-2018]|nr:MAG: rRNA maturation RNase YbeY [Methylococcales symbiont of Hymedesmia sp. n. MRB-2018]KAF3983870.1 MAG: rRNA maturation RNase YbeY [Methylococcales symbiont of Hymedesmia sp. n. MRB-2018]